MPRLRNARCNSAEVSSSSIGTSRSSISMIVTSVLNRLKTDANSRAQHDHRFRHSVEVEKLVAGHDARRLDLQSGEEARRRPRGDDHVLGGNLARQAGRVLHRHAAFPLEPAGAFEDSDLVLPHQKIDALGELADNPVLAGHDLVEMQFEAFDADAEFRGVVDQVVNVGGVE
jgi:hypothetical protein